MFWHQKILLAMLFRHAYHVFEPSQAETQVPIFQSDIIFPPTRWYPIADAVVALAAWDIETATSVPDVPIDHDDYCPHCGSFLPNGTLTNYSLYADRNGGTIAEEWFCHDCCGLPAAEGGALLIRTGGSAFHFAVVEAADGRAWMRGQGLGMNPPRSYVKVCKIEHDEQWEQIEGTPMPYTDHAQPAGLPCFFYL